MQRRTLLKTAAAVPLTALAGFGFLPQATAHQPSLVDALTERLNPQVQQARDAALSILRPSAKELERGLRLHAESVVFDAYGFG